MPLLIICSHCNHAVPSGDASPKRRVCPFCSRPLDAAVVEDADAENRRGQRKRRTRLVMTEAEAKAPVEEPRPEQEPVEVLPSEPDAVPASSALAVDPSGSGEALWKPLGHGAALIRAGFVIEWAAVSVFVAVVGAVLYLLAPDPRVPASVRTSAFHQEFRVLGPPLVLLLAFGLLVGGALVAVGRVLQALAPWDLPSGRSFRVTAVCELVHTLCALVFAWSALAVYLNLDTAAGGRASGTVWPLPVLVLGLASRVAADFATIVNFGFASAALPSESLRRRTAAVAVALTLFGTGWACVLAAGVAVGTVGDLVRSGEAADVTHFVGPSAMGYAGFTVYMLLGVALQRAARRAARARDA
ncbi:zinc ribbon domain-containing protein [Frigoriglobus tundricola]|uniref:Uncharacterized protein n=1 Tax=Frigoriglobus tundricola TaxID=2774151 RepID=A0A6M5YG36_9BACT|nr:zinc ribbon domain-containing protein [Frigoriglobus tundricola]QJW92975.1 hypothetical protein FTUN_0473 [Frigoriglobus tundricola]